MAAGGSGASQADAVAAADASLIAARNAAAVASAGALISRQANQSSNNRSFERTT